MCTVVHSSDWWWMSQQWRNRRHLSIKTKLEQPNSTTFSGYTTYIWAERNWRKYVFVKANHFLNMPRQQKLADPAPVPSRVLLNKTIWDGGVAPSTLPHWPSGTNSDHLISFWIISVLRNYLRKSAYTYVHPCLSDPGIPGPIFVSGCPSQTDLVPT